MSSSGATMDTDGTLLEYSCVSYRVSLLTYIANVDSTHHYQLLMMLNSDINLLHIVHQICRCIDIVTRLVPTIPIDTLIGFAVTYHSHMGTNKCSPKTPSLLIDERIRGASI